MRPPTTRSAARWLPLLLASGAVGCLSLFSSDPAAPRGRGARFDRFVDELHLTLIDTADRIEGIRLRGARPPVAPVVVEAPAATRGVGFIWQEAERLEARRVAMGAALERLDGEFAAGRFSDPDRRSASRVIKRDLLRALGLPDDATGTEIAEATVRAEPLSLWGGPPFAAAATLLGEFNAEGRPDLERWREHLEALPGEIRAAAAELTAESLQDAYGLRAPRVLVALLDVISDQRVAIGNGRPTDPLLGPYVAARERILGESNALAMSSIPIDLRREFKDAYREIYDALRAARTELGQTRRNQTVVPLEGERRRRWLIRLTDAAGARATPDSLEILAQAEIQRLTAEIGTLLELDSPEDPDAVRAELQRVRTGERSIERSARATRLDALWAAEEENLEDFIELPERFRILLSSRPAAAHEWPHGRWSPFVPGDLRLAPRGRETRELPARPGVYLVPRSSTDLVPSWLQEANALRHGPAGHGLVDAFRRAATNQSLYLRARPDPAFTEGWSLYAMAELDAAGLHPEGTATFGLLAQELIAFTALVVDVGMHERGWSADQAKTTIMELTPLGRLPAQEMILRSISFPGRVALPAIGLLRLRSLRNEASARLGERFDPRAFRRSVLEGGPVPMSELDRRVERWLEELGAG